MSPPLKGIRRRAGHKSCEACQVSKLRCVREQSDLDCNRCRTHGVECRLPDRRPRKPRTGRRLELAKTLYGDTDIASSSTSPAPSSMGPAVRGISETSDVDASQMNGYELGAVVETTRPTSYGSTPWSSAPASPSPTAVMRRTGDVDIELVEYDKESFNIGDVPPSPSFTDVFLISEYSVESALASMELAGRLSSHLIEEWFATCQFPVPVSQWQDFRVQFEEAGRKPEQLRSPRLEVMAALLIAGGARISSAPCVVGVDVAGLHLNKIDLAHFGKSRAAVCQALAQRAIRLADERGIFRDESSESISVLIMLATSLDRSDTTRARGRPYRVAAAAHARAIVEDGARDRDYLALVDGPLGWMLYINDTWEAATSGRAPNLECINEELIFQDVEHDLPTIDELSRALAGNSDNRVWYPIGKMWGYVTRLMRNVHRYIRQGPGSPDVWAVILEAYEKLDEYKRCFMSMQTILGQFMVSRRPGFPLLRQHIAMSLIPAMLVTFYIHRALKNWVEASPLYSTLPSHDMITLQTIKTESDRRMDQCARELPQLFEYLLQILPSRGALSLVPSIGIAYVTLPAWAERLCALPTLEDGFATNYTLDEKAKEMGWFMDAVHALSWSYDDKIIDETRGILQRGLTAAGVIASEMMPCESIY